MVCDVARAMGFEGFDFISPHEIFREHARLTAHHNDGRRALNLGAWANITAAEYKNWEPAAWPMAESRESARGPMFARWQVPASRRQGALPAARRRACPRTRPRRNIPLVLNTGRVRDHWHTMTRTGKSARLSAHMAEPYAEINTADALRFKVRAGELATLRSKWGSMVVRVRTGADIPPGMVFAPIHWNRAFASDARVGALTNPGGRSDLRRTRAQAHAGVHRALRRVAGTRVMLTRSPLPPPATQWWTKVQGEKFVRYELAGNHSRDWSHRGAPAAGRAGGRLLADVDWIEYRDPARRVYRAAWFVDDRLEGCIYFDRLPALPERAWLARMFAQAKLRCRRRAPASWRAAHSKASDQGALVCSCFGVGANPIAACARELGAAATPAEIGKRLKCGTNCGSCIPEIQVIIGEVAKKSRLSLLVVFAASPFRGDIVRLPAFFA